jgi:hypothetical protein
MTQGLFTQGPTVEDLLQKRRQRAGDLQQQLMQQAAQGARNPEKARAISFLGSSLGRALGGAMGGEDKEMQKRETAEAKRQELVGQNMEASQGSAAAMFAHAKVLQGQNYTKAAADMTNKAVAKQKEEKEVAAAAQSKAEDDLVTQARIEEEKMAAQAVQDYAYALGNSFEDNKGFQTHLQSGRASPKMIELAEKQIAEKNEAGPLTNDGKLLVESGMIAGTPEFKAALKDIIAKKGTLRNIPSPMEQRQMLTGYIQEDKQYVQAKEKLQMVDSALNLLPSIRAGAEKPTALFVRTVSEVYNSQTKAVSEIDRLISYGSWGTNMTNWINEGFTGTPTAITLDEYESVLTIMDNAMRGVVNGVIDTQAGIYGDLMTGDNLAKSTENLRVPAQREAAPTTSSVTSDLGPVLGTSDKPNGSQMVNGKKYLIRDGKVYASKE